MNTTADTNNQNVRLGVLQAGRVPPEMADEHLDYDQLFVRLLGEDSFEYHHWAVLDGFMPDSIDDADAWLITGSRFGAYEDLPWIPPLEDFIREVYASEKPMVGICFGHQVIAQALGGKVWGSANHKTTDQTALLAFHQDQVVVAPDSAKTVGSTDFCEHAALLYGNQMLTIQPHPEFYSEFIGGLLEARRNILPEDIREGAAETLHQPIVREPIADTLRNFLKRENV